ncbi:hypothetical protein FB45DRAFT_1029613 [Roridomyces roridus]|uniref:Ribonuclease H1 N-terminal domain-containing protein n=1 Tax=Roridomyces roridus TaxID=1738132 RepID=A0AAD7BQL4_9AGAR|nr:hypothetical protein FB45DRAFT_1029613 [Roridomyces roridus]
MPRGRPRLDPEVKLEHLKQSRRKYEDENVESRRRKARERMQRTRARIAKDPIAFSKYKQKAAQHSDDYRYRKSETERGAHRLASRAHKKKRRNKISTRSTCLPVLSANGVFPGLQALLGHDIFRPNAAYPRWQHPTRTTAATRTPFPHLTNPPGPRDRNVLLVAATVSQRNSLLLLIMHNGLDAAFQQLALVDEPIYFGNPKVKYRENIDFHVVIRGFVPGVYETWARAGPQVTGFPGNIHNKYRGWTAALRYLRVINDRIPPFSFDTLDAFHCTPPLGDTLLILTIA